jgi:hypothetical protein
MNLPLKMSNSVFVGGDWIKASGERRARSAGT